MVNFHSSPPLSNANAKFDIFLNHRGIDTKDTVASLVYHNLQNKGFKVFLDKYSIKKGDDIEESIKCGIRTAAVHVVIFSPNYAESEFCLKELRWILKSGAQIVPVFWRITPSNVQMEGDDGAYAQAFEEHKKSGKFNALKLWKWKKALRRVSDLGGHIYEGDEGEMLERIARSVTECLELAKSQSKLSKVALKMRRMF